MIITRYSYFPINIKIHIIIIYIIYYIIDDIYIYIYTIYLALGVPLLVILCLISKSQYHPGPGH